MTWFFPLILFHVTSTFVSFSVSLDLALCLGGLVCAIDSSWRSLPSNQVFRGFIYRVQKQPLSPALCKRRFQAATKMKQQRMPSWQSHQLQCYSMEKLQSLVSLPSIAWWFPRRCRSWLAAFNSAGNLATSSVPQAHESLPMFQTKWCKWGPLIASTQLFPLCRVRSPRPWSRASNYWNTRRSIARPFPWKLDIEPDFL